MKSTAKEVAATILSECKARNIEVTNLKLQPLVYYCEAWNLGLDKKSLFDDDFEAWIQGPVVPSVFYDYKENRWSPIRNAKGKPSCDTEVVDHVNEVLDAYGDMDATDLERLVRQEGPWLQARRGLHADVPSHEIISRDAMRGFYKALIILNGE